MDKKNKDQAELLSELQNRFKQLTSAIYDDREDLASIGVGERGGNDMGDESNQELETILGLGRAERDSAELALLERAISRLQKGTYGLCVDCEEEIDAKRLEVNPTAERCMDCQENLENTQDQRDRTPSL